MDCLDCGRSKSEHPDSDERCTGYIDETSTQYCPRCLQSFREVRCGPVLVDVVCDCGSTEANAHRAKDSSPPLTEYRRAPQPSWVGCPLAPDSRARGAGGRNSQRRRLLKWRIEWRVW